MFLFPNYFFFFSGLGDLDDGKLRTSTLMGQAQGYRIEVRPFQFIFLCFVFSNSFFYSFHGMGTWMMASSGLMGQAQGHRIEVRPFQFIFLCFVFSNSFFYSFHGMGTWKMASSGLVL